MSGGAYWEERERAKSEALKMAARLSAREKGLVVTATRRTLANDVAHDQTQQRSFERGFLSLDHPDEDGSMYDYGDCGRAMRRMLRARRLRTEIMRRCGISRATYFRRLACLCETFGAVT